MGAGRDRRHLADPRLRRSGLPPVLLGCGGAPRPRSSLLRPRRSRSGGGSCSATRASSPRAGSWSRRPTVRSPRRPSTGRRASSRTLSFTRRSSAVGSARRSSVTPFGTSAGAASTASSLKTDSANTSKAWRLYERVGMRTVRTYDEWEKRLDLTLRLSLMVFASDLLREQALLVGPAGCCGPVRYAELPVDVAEVELDRLFGYPKPPRHVSS